MVARLKRNYQLLIADDDEGFRAVLRTIFSPYFCTLEAGSGEEAVRMAERHDVHLALFDMHMHVLTGLETLRIVKTIKLVLPCILITSDASEQLRRAAAEAAAHAVLQKPVTKRELMTAVSSALADAYDDPEMRLLLGPDLDAQSSTGSDASWQGS